jgi:SAM-dependent methyltransferase
MDFNSSNNADHYNELVARQVDQYKETEVMHDLPRIYDYWAGKYISKNAEQITGYSNIIEFYAEYFRRALHESNSTFLLSIGSGDCSIEIEIVKNLIFGGEKQFFFVCLELSPILIEKARKKIDSEGLGDIITVAQIDLNKWSPKYKFASAMAHHALHHILDLEHLFGVIKDNLAPRGRFITCDIIGRNGHMRWPEALRLTREIWQRIPRKYKFNHQFQNYDEYFQNRDSSTEGFEGIRAQDILPLLTKMFSFEVFFGFGNLTDTFIDRGFGPNFNPENSHDTEFIDYVHKLNEQLISDGILKPTSMIAVLVNEPVSNTKVYKHWTPAFCIRNPEALEIDYDIEPLLRGIPFQLVPGDNPMVANQIGTYSLEEELLFNNGEKPLREGQRNGIKLLKYGWGNPEADFTWSICEDAAIMFPLEKKTDTDLLMEVAFVPYISPLSDHTTVEMLINNVQVKRWQFNGNGDNGSNSFQIVIPGQLIKNSPVIEVRFMLPNRRMPQFESGSDVRQLGIGLMSVKIGLK